MRGDLIINGKDAYETWGVRMGEGFIDAISAPPQMKAYIENRSRLEHGKRVIVDKEPKQEDRSLTLQFTIQGDSPSDFFSKRNAFFEELRKVKIDIKVPKLGEEVYHLLYTGKSTTYGQSISRTFAKVASKFDEPNPANRD